MEVFFFQSYIFGKYQLVFASTENVWMNPFFFVDEKKQPHPFTRVCQFASNKLWQVNLGVKLLVCFKVSFTIKWKKFLYID